MFTSVIPSIFKLNHNESIFCQKKNHSSRMTKSEPRHSGKSRGKALLGLQGESRHRILSVENKSPESRKRVSTLAGRLG